jgi:hypothetical protein
MLDLISREKEICQLVEICQKNHPYRPVDWRWRLVSSKDKIASIFRNNYQSLFDQAFPDLEDKELHQEIENLYLYCPYSKGSQNQPGSFHEKLIKYMELVPEEIRHAYFIYCSEELSADYPLEKGFLESYLLTRLSYDEIAEKLKLKRKTVEFYEKTFFNIKDRLDDLPWIMNVVIGYESMFSAPITKYFRLWKPYGYFCGHEILERIIKSTLPTVPSYFIPQEKGEESLVLEQELRNVLLIKLIILARNLQAETGADSVIVLNLIKSLASLQPKTTASTPAANITVASTSISQNYINNLPKFADNLEKLAEYIKEIPIEVSLPVQTDDALSNIEKISIINN